MILIAKESFNSDIRVGIDLQNKTPGEKIWKWVKKGVPIRLEIGQKEVDKNSVFMGRRDLDTSDKKLIDKDEFVASAQSILDDIQENLFNKAKKFLSENSFQVNSREGFYKFFDKEDKQPGFIYAYWVGDDETENELKQKLKVTARCIPLSSKNNLGTCIFTGANNAKLTIFARAY